MKIVVIVQARMSSRRLPGKVLLPIAGKLLLQWVLEAVAASRTVDAVLLATSDDASDDSVAAFAAASGWSCFRGPLENVAKRFLLAAESVQADAVVRICGDSPLLDHRLIDQAVDLFREGGCDLATNIKVRTFPNGASVEVFSTEILRKLVACVETREGREHVTPWFYRNDAIRIRDFQHEPKLNHIRLTVDTTEDFVLLERMLGALERPHTEYALLEIVELRDRMVAELETACVGACGSL